MRKFKYNLFIVCLIILEVIFVLLSPVVVLIYIEVETNLAVSSIRIPNLCFIVLGILLTIVATYFGIRIVWNCKKREIFSAQNSKYLAWISKLCLCIAILILMVILVTAFASQSFHGLYILMFIAAAGFFVGFIIFKFCKNLFMEAVEYKEENDLIV